MTWKFILITIFIVAANKSLFWHFLFVRPPRVLCTLICICKTAKSWELTFTTVQKLCRFYERHRRLNLFLKEFNVTVSGLLWIFLMVLNGLKHEPGGIHPARVGSGTPETTVLCEVASNIQPVLSPSSAVTDSQVRDGLNVITRIFSWLFVRLYQNILLMHIGVQYSVNLCLLFTF